MDLTLLKVDAHTGDIFNEQADRLAGEGANSGSTFKINPNYIREQQCHFKWKGESIDTDIKSFVKKKEEIESLTTWFTQHHTKDSALRSFSLKLLNEELPTMTTLYTRKPDIYTKPECPFCGKYKETNTHVFLCSEKGKQLKISFRATVKKIYTKEKGNKDLKGLMEKITRGHFMKINHNRQVFGTQPHDRFEFNDLIRGLIPKSLYKIIRSTLNSADMAKQMVMNIFKTWKEILYNNWKKR
ncbi:8551_t:CDS:2, partial [Diversispora eburnea]